MDPDTLQYARNSVLNQIKLEKIREREERRTEREREKMERKRKGRKSDVK